MRLFALIILISLGLFAHAPAHAYDSRGPVGVPAVEVDMSVLGDETALQPDPVMIPPSNLPTIERPQQAYDSSLENERVIDQNPPSKRPQTRRLTQPIAPPIGAARAISPPPVIQTAQPPAPNRQIPPPQKLAIEDYAKQKQTERPPVAPVAPVLPAQSAPQTPLAEPKTVTAPSLPARPKPQPKGDTQIDFTRTREDARTSLESNSAPIRSEPVKVVDKFDVRLLFEPNGTNLPLPEQAKLSEVISQLKAHEQIRLQLRAYASSETGSNSSARRISLSRALAVRAYLMDQGIRPTRVDVRALGTDTAPGPLDRVDVQLIN